MKRLAITLSSLVILALILIGLLLAIHGPIVIKTDNATENAIMIAVNYPDIRHRIAEDYFQYSVISVTLATNVTSPAFGMPAISNVPGNIYNVHLRIGGFPLSAMENRIVTVNESGGRVIGQFQYFARNYPSWAEADISPGASWCIMMPTAFWTGENALKTGIDLNVTPKNASVYPIIVEGDNVERLLSGGDYDAVVYFDDYADRNISYNGSIQVSDGWRTHVVVYSDTPYSPYYPLKTTYIYLAIMNGDTRTVHIDYTPSIF